MHIVFFVESYGKNANINGVCVKNIVDVLVNQGHKVTVFSSLTNNKNKKREIIDSVKVCRIERDFSAFLMNKLKTHYNRGLNIFTNIYMKVNALLFYVILNKWPMRSYLTRFKYVSVAKKELKNESVDLFVGVYFHIDEVLAAIKMKQYYPNAKVATYMLDAMGGRKNPLFFKKFDTKQSVQRWEKFCLKNSELIFPMKAHKNYFLKSNYENSIIKKIKYADIPLMKLKDEKEIKVKDKTRDKIVIVYTGFASKETGSARYFLRMLEQNPFIEFHMYGRLSYEEKELVENHLLYNKNVFFHGFVDNREITEIQNKADYLVTFGSCAECMISGKIFEYMSRKKPILCFFQIEEDVNISYLSKYPNALILQEKEELLYENVKKMQDFFEKPKEVITNEMLEALFVENMPEYTANLFLKV